jgi:hypothetical protein
MHRIGEGVEKVKKGKKKKPHSSSCIHPDLEVVKIDFSG